MPLMGQLGTVHRPYQEFDPVNERHSIRGNLRLLLSECTRPRVMIMTFEITEESRWTNEIETVT